MSNFKILVILGLVSSILCATTVVNEQFTSNSYLNYFSLQCSYDDVGCSKHFQLVDYQGTNRLQLTVFPNDHSHSQDHITDPRSELRLKSTIPILPETLYTVTWNVDLTTYTSGYDFCFFQCFAGTNPNIMLRWRNSHYEIMVESFSGTTIFTLPGNVAFDVNQTITWRVSFVLTNTSKGFVQIERKLASDSSFQTLGNFPGKTSFTANDNAYLKFGIYTQHTGVQLTKMLISDMLITKN